MSTENTADDATQDDSTGERSVVWDFEEGAEPVFAVVSAVADVTGEDPLELPPLARAIDPEALNDLFMSRPNAGVDAVTFEYYGYSVLVRGDGAVRLTPLETD